jgi:hypothetical protein
MVGTNFIRPFNVLAQPFEECTVALSSDGGETWQLGDQPANHMPTHPYGCGDGVAATGPDGTFYAGGGATSATGFIAAPPFFFFHGDAVVSSSSDKGHTWTAPVSAIGSTTPASRFDQCSWCAPADPTDREFLAVDQSNGTLYESSANIGGTGQRFVTASTDKGQTFGKIYSADSPDYPGRGGTIAAGHGRLAVAYRASAAPGATCPCVIFETSADHGATFDRHVVPVSGASTSGGPFLAGSPETPGRYALTVLNAANTALQVYATQDFGATWSGPTVVGQDPPGTTRFHPAISYSPNGKIVVAWRVRYADAKYDVYIARGKHQGSNGAVFSAPVKVTSVAGAYPPGPTFGDDQTYVVSAQKDAYVGWGDSRTGATQIWVGRIDDKALKG